MGCTVSKPVNFPQESYYDPSSCTSLSITPITKRDSNSTLSSESGSVSPTSSLRLKPLTVTTTTHSPIKSPPSNISKPRLILSNHEIISNKETEFNLVKRLDSKHFNPDEDCYLISNKWYQMWLDYLTSSSSKIPTRIDNEILLDAESQIYYRTNYSNLQNSTMISNTQFQLKLDQDLKIKTHFRTISQKVWEHLYKTYGGGPILVFKVPNGYPEYVYTKGSWIQKVNLNSIVTIIPSIFYPNEPVPKGFNMTVNPLRSLKLKKIQDQIEKTQAEINEQNLLLVNSFFKDSVENSKKTIENNKILTNISLTLVNSSTSKENEMLKQEIEKIDEEITKNNDYLKLNNLASKFIKKNEETFSKEFLNKDIIQNYTNRQHNNYANLIFLRKFIKYFKISQKDNIFSSAKSNLQEKSKNLTYNIIRTVKIPGFSFSKDNEKLKSNKSSTDIITEDFLKPYGLSTENIDFVKNNAYGLLYNVASNIIKYHFKKNYHIFKINKQNFLLKKKKIEFIVKRIQIMIRKFLKKRQFEKNLKLNNSAKKIQSRWKRYLIEKRIRNTKKNKELLTSMAKLEQSQLYSQSTPDLNIDFKANKLLNFYLLRYINRFRRRRFLKENFKFPLQITLNESSGIPLGDRSFLNSYVLIHGESNSRYKKWISYSEPKRISLCSKYTDEQILAIPQPTQSSNIFKKSVPSRVINNINLDANQNQDEEPGVSTSLYTSNVAANSVQPKWKETAQVANVTIKDHIVFTVLNKSNNHNLIGEFLGQAVLNLSDYPQILACLSGKEVKEDSITVTLPLRRFILPIKTVQMNGAAPLSSLPTIINKNCNPSGTIDVTIHLPKSPFITFQDSKCKVEPSYIPMYLKCGWLKKKPVKVFNTKSLCKPRFAIINTNSMSYYDNEYNLNQNRGEIKLENIRNFNYFNEKIFKAPCLYINDRTSNVFFEFFFMTSLSIIEDRKETQSWLLTLLYSLRLISLKNQAIQDKSISSDYLQCSILYNNKYLLYNKDHYIQSLNLELDQNQPKY